MQIKYIAFDKRVFDSEQECFTYEKKIQMARLSALYRRYFHYKRCVLPMRNAAYEGARKVRRGTIMREKGVSKKIAKAYYWKTVWETLTLLKRDIEELRNCRKEIKQIRRTYANS